MLDPLYVYDITSGKIGATIAIIGLLGNIFSTIIWTRISSRPRNGKRDQTPACAAYFLAMAVIDSFLLIFFMVGESLPVFIPQLKRSWSYAWLYSFIIYPLSSFFLTSSIWIVVAVTVHRFLFVIYGKTFSFRKNIITIIIINIVGFLAQIPQFFHFRPNYISEDNIHDCYWTFQSTSFSKTQSFTDYLFWLHCIFIVLLPLILIIILNVLLLHNINKSNDSVFKSLSNSEQGSRMKKSRQMTIILLTVTITFLILLLWQCIAQCFWLLEYHKADPDQTIWNTVNASYAVSRLGIIIHSSINCLLYFVSGPIFRKEVRKIFGLKKESRTSTSTELRSTIGSSC